jgi:hypothetical protein
VYVRATSSIGVPIDRGGSKYATPNLIAPAGEPGREWSVWLREKAVITSGTAQRKIEADMNAPGYATKP